MTSTPPTGGAPTSTAPTGAAPTSRPPRPAARTSRRARRPDTPALLRLALVAVVVSGLAAGGLGGLAAHRRAAGLERARADTRDVVRLQDVGTRLVVADAAAGDDVLRGTRDGGSRARRFGYALQPAATGVPMLAADASDPRTLAVANLWLARYSGQVEVARALAREGRPGAVPAVAAASTTLRTRVLPVVGTAREEAASRLRRDATTSSGSELLALAVAVLACTVLLALQVWLARRFRRLLAPPLALALVLLAGAAVLVGGVVRGSRAEVDRVTRGPSAVAQDLVTARSAAFAARSAEALAVVAGRTPAAEPAWQRSMREAEDALAAARRSLSTSGEATEAAAVVAAREQLDGYRTAHGRLRAAASEGDRETEVAVALDASTLGPLGAFEGFDAASGSLLARQVQAADDGWARATNGLRAGALAAWAVAVLVTVLGPLGLRGRLREYA
ncbi:hypothetical protein [Kineosporia sp. A_224]|uniref:hypothetical protein n=1 Tax=Kineosporia sp. A_224 TaxID=1962180 RepID=UPI000B4AC524|nr:hypothetical protein [Kineosporia sp. A_224]